MGNKHLTALDPLQASLANTTQVATSENTDATVTTVVARVLDKKAPTTSKSISTKPSAKNATATANNTTATGSKPATKSKDTTSNSKQVTSNTNNSTRTNDYDFAMGEPPEVLVQTTLTGMLFPSVQDKVSAPEVATERALLATAKKISKTARIQMASSRKKASVKTPKATVTPVTVEQVSHSKAVSSSDAKIVASTTASTATTALTTTTTALKVHPAPSSTVLAETVATSTNTSSTGPIISQVKIDSNTTTPAVGHATSSDMPTTVVTPVSTTTEAETTTPDSPSDNQMMLATGWSVAKPAQIIADTDYFDEQDYGYFQDNTETIVTKLEQSLAAKLSNSYIAPEIIQPESLPSSDLLLDPLQVMTSSSKTPATPVEYTTGLTPGKIIAATPNEAIQAVEIDLRQKIKPILPVTLAADGQHFEPVHLGLNFYDFKHYRSFDQLFSVQKAALIQDLQQAIITEATSLGNKLFTISGPNQSFVHYLVQGVLDFAYEVGYNHSDILYLDFKDMVKTLPVKAQFAIPVKPIIIIKNVHYAVQRPLWEQALINTFNNPNFAHSLLLFSSETPISSLEFNYPDLTSRLCRGKVYNLQHETKAQITRFILNYCLDLGVHFQKKTLECLVDLIFADKQIDIDSTIECLLVLCATINTKPSKLTSAQVLKYQDLVLLHDSIVW